MVLIVAGLLRNHLACQGHWARTDPAGDHRYPCI